MNDGKLTTPKSLALPYFLSLSSWFFLFNVHVDSFLIPTLFIFSEHSLAFASNLVMLERSPDCLTNAYDESAELGNDVVGTAMISQDLAGTSP
jgi:hypothetical protein